jgi:hypothetical protein
MAEDKQALWGSWLLIADMLKQGKDPTPEYIAAVLRDPDCKLPPPEVRNYIAGLLDSTLKRKRGRPPEIETELEWIASLCRDHFICADVRRHKRGLERLARIRGVPIEDSYHAALERTSRDWKIPAGTIDKIIFPRRR